MSRLEKKCLIASAGGHGLLLLLLFVGPALMLSQRKEDNLPVLTFLPSTAVDEMVVSGGSPMAASAPAPSSIPPEVSLPPQQTTTPPPADPVPPPVSKPPPPAPKAEQEPPPKAEPKKTPPKPQAEPERDTVKKSDSKNNLNDKPKKPKKPDTSKPDEGDTSSTSSTKPQRHKVQPTFTEVSDGDAKARAAEAAKARARAEAEAREQAQRAFTAQVQQSLARLGTGLSSGTSVDVPGPGGAAYANYGLIIKAIYAERWLPPSELSSDSTVVKARVVIRKDGSVSEARVTRSSGNRTLDRSVERALEIRKVPPFPDGAKDSERVFHIDFDLKTKRQSG